MVQVTATMLSCSAIARQILRPLARQYSYLQWRRENHFSIRYFSSKEIAPATKTPDFLLQNIKASINTNDLLQIVGTHHSIMNTLHVKNALRVLFELHKSGNSSISKTEIVSSTEFKNLCKRLKSQVRSIELNDTIDALKILSYMGVPANSLICQSLLQIIRHNVNELSLHQIIFLDFIMKDFNRCPLVDALKIALPLVFESQLRIKMNAENVAHLTEMLQYVSKKSTISESCMDFIVEALEKRVEDIEIKFAKSITRSLCEPQKTSPLYRHLMFQCLNKIVANLDNCSFDETEILLDAALKKMQKQPLFYHEVFIDSCMEHLLTLNCDFIHGTYTLRKLTRMKNVDVDSLQMLLAVNLKCPEFAQVALHCNWIPTNSIDAERYFIICNLIVSDRRTRMAEHFVQGHVSLKLIDYLGKKLDENPKILQDCKISVYLSFLNGMANADYTPNNWDECVKEAVQFNQILDYKDKLELPWIRLALDLATLGIYKQDLIEHIFQEAFLERFLSRDYNKLDYLQLLQLYQIVVTVFPDYKGPFPPRHILEKAMKYNDENVLNFPLKPCLEHALGGPAYVQTHLYTKLGHIIDYAVVMRKGGYPVAMNQNMEGGMTSKTYLEDLIVPSDSQIILLMCLPESSYSINCRRLRAFSTLTIRSLEALGYAVVPVPIGHWNNIPDHEKIPYLMQNLKEKCVLLDSKELSSAV